MKNRCVVTSVKYLVVNLLFLVTTINHNYYNVYVIIPIQLYNILIPISIYILLFIMKANSATAEFILIPNLYFNYLF